MLASFAPLFFWIRVVSAVVSFILLGGIVYLIMQIDYFSDRREYGWRIWRGKKGEKKRSLRKWKTILEDVASGDASRLTNAVLTAQGLVGETLRVAGYKGASFGELLHSVSETDVPCIVETRRMYKDISEYIEKKEELSRQDVKALLRLFREILRQFGVVD